LGREYGVAQRQLLDVAVEVAGRHRDDPWIRQTDWRDPSLGARVLEYFREGVYAMQCAAEAIAAQRKAAQSVQEAAGISDIKVLRERVREYVLRMPAASTRTIEESKRLRTREILWSAEEVARGMGLSLDAAADISAAFDLMGSVRIDYGHLVVEILWPMERRMLK
jgi:hypothetical protein